MNTTNMLATKGTLNNRTDSQIKQHYKLFENPRVQPPGVSKLDLKRVTFSDVGSVKSSARSNCSMPKNYTSKSLAERIKRHTLKLMKTFDTNHNNIVDF